MWANLWTAKRHCAVEYQRQFILFKRHVFFKTEKKAIVSQQYKCLLRQSNPQNPLSYSCQGSIFPHNLQCCSITKSCSITKRMQWQVSRMLSVWLVGKVPETMPIVMYISLMDLVKPLLMVPRLMRKPPTMIMGRNPNRLLNTVARGAGETGTHRHTQAYTRTHTGHPRVQMATGLAPLILNLHQGRQHGSVHLSYTSTSQLADEGQRNDQGGEKGKRPCPRSAKTCRCAQPGGLSSGFCSKLYLS